MGRIAFLMPGQGAQAVGMGKAFYDEFPQSREIYKQANSLLGYDLTALCFEGPIAELTKTAHCQPALFVTSLASFAAFQARFPSLIPVGSAGLSLGELTALASAGAMSFSDGLYLVKIRAEAMEESVTHNPGAMLAILGSSMEIVKEICDESGAVAANLNAPDQVVLSGSVLEISRAQELAKLKGVKRAIKLDVAGAFHSPLMKEASDKLHKAISKVRFQRPRFPVISNVTSRPVEDHDEMPRILVRQIVSPVLWDASIRYLIDMGAEAFLEFAPAKVLSGLLKRIDSNVKALTLDKPEDLENLEY